MMALTHVELYEALKPFVGEDAARMMAEVVPPARDLATRSDLAEVRSEFAELKADFAELKADFADLKADFSDLRAEFAELRGEMHSGLSELRGEMHSGFAELRAEVRSESTRNLKWIVGVFLPFFAVMWGSSIALFLRASPA